MDLTELRHLISLILESDRSRRFNEASTSGGSLGTASFENFSDEDSGDSGSQEGAPFDPTVSPRFSSSKSRSQDLIGACEEATCMDDDPNDIVIRFEGRRKIKREVSGVAALGGGPSVPLGAPAQAVGITSRIRPRRSRKRSRK
ncbi:MAG: hypothetical protein EBZ49_01575 [Proteobacteria bacterium]|nr:hypothetical protein [Pseudomonadota bacterium]